MPPPIHDVCRASRSIFAYCVLMGACNPTLCPIHVFRAKLKLKDVIYMKTAGTGFAEKGAEIKKLKTAIAMGT